MTRITECFWNESYRAICAEDIPPELITLIHIQERFVSRSQETSNIFAMPGFCVFGMWIVPDAFQFMIKGLLCVYACDALDIVVCRKLELMLGLVEIKNNFSFLFSYNILGFFYHRTHGRILGVFWKCSVIDQTQTWFRCLHSNHITWLLGNPPIANENNALLKVLLKTEITGFGQTNFYFRPLKWSY